MFRVVTGSRLHFGLLSLAAADARWPDADGRPALPARRYGGAGLMIDVPGTIVRFEEAEEWSAVGPLAERALAFARRFAETVPHGPPQRLLVEAVPPQHAGLGVGTQLGLAVARGLAAARGLDLPAAELARRVGRGGRSALGVHGFEGGGFLVDAGHGPRETELAPLAARLEFPEDWRLVLTLPDGPPGLHGDAEREVIAGLAGRVPPERTDALCRLVLLGLLPALAEGDLPAFGEALHDFNRRSGELFAPAQGGVYASAAVAGVIAWLRGEGVAGVGQSSWGPTVFAVVGDPDRADHLTREACRRFSARTWRTRARNRGAVTEREGS
jgi:beta-ribofuranosylaminobenzene 5'-phosphate synthase